MGRHLVGQGANGMGWPLVCRQDQQDEMVARGCPWEPHRWAGKSNGQGDWEGEGWLSLHSGSIPPA